jgi:L-ascorbate 6-phosphate lactonase
MDFASRVASVHPAPREAAVFWLGQAGFLIKTHGGRLTAIDPYFSDCVMRLIPEAGLGFKRLMPPPCEADAIAFDALLISHEHNDHFDVDAIEAMMRNGRTRAYCPAQVAAEMRAMGLGMSRVEVLAKGACVDLGDMTLTAVDCDHGTLAPDALGFLLDLGFTRVYYAGDTALSPDRLAVPLSVRPEVAILPINGAFGNLDGSEAAEYAGMLGAKRVIPCHFWTFPMHHGDPQQIIEALPQKAPDCVLTLMCQGEHVMV